MLITETQMGVYMFRNFLGCVYNIKTIFYSSFQISAYGTERTKLILFILWYTPRCPFQSVNVIKLAVGKNELIRSRKVKQILMRFNYFFSLACFQHYYV